MLRHTIFFTVSGGLIGVGVACLILRSVWLTQTALRALRLGLWLPTLILFVTPDVFALGIATAILCGCYYYLAATSFLFLPLSNISLIVLWLFSWVAVGWILPAPRFLDYWHKVIAVGCLTFFPFVQALWGLRDRPVPYRILLAIDNALPVAFVAMCYGEMYAATAGLGFMMVVASATSQFDKGLAGFLVTVALLVGLSSILRWTVRRLYFAEISA
jgi:hypothetical protein